MAYRAAQVLDFVNTYPAGEDRFMDGVKRTVAAKASLYPETLHLVTQLMNREAREREMTEYAANPGPVPSEAGETIVYWRGTDEAGREVALLQGRGAKAAKLWLKYRHGFVWSFELAGFQSNLAEPAFLSVLHDLAAAGFIVVPKPAAGSRHVYQDFPRFAGQHRTSCQLGGSLGYAIQLAGANSAIVAMPGGDGTHRTLKDAKNDLNAYLFEQAAAYLEFIAFACQAGPSDLGASSPSHSRGSGEKRGRPQAELRWSLTCHGLASRIARDEAGGYVSFSAARADLVAYLNEMHVQLMKRMAWLSSFRVADAILNPE